MLVDGWEIYNGALLSPEVFENNPPKPDGYVFIGQFGGFDLGEADASPHGCATYRLRIELPDKPKTYMLELPEIFSAYCLYINGKEAFKMGDPSPQDYRPALGNRTVSFEADGSVELIFIVTDFTHFYSGMVYPPAFGDPEAVSSLLNVRLVFRSVLCSVVLTIGLLSLLIGVLNKRRSPSLLFFFLCLCYAGYAAYPIVRVFFSGYYPWYFLENISFNAMLAAVMLLAAAVCGMKTIWRRLSVFLGLFACLAATSLHIILPAGSLRAMLAYSSFMTFYVWVFAVFITFVSCAGVYKDAVSSRLLLCGALIFDCAMVMDRLLPLHEPIITGWFHELAGFMLVMAIGLAVGKELATGYREAAVLREREDALEKLAGIQQSYYRILEEKAAEVNSSRHDLRHHYLAIGSLIRDNKQEELESYLTESLRAIDDSGPRVYCSNSIVNALANHYQHIAEQNAISFDMRCDIDGVYNIPDAHLSGILGNLFENAIDACLRIDTGRRFIRVAITRVGSLLTIRFLNSTNEHVQEMDTGFLSSKRGGGFGYGLDSIRAIAKKCSGEAHFQWDKAEKVFQSTVTMILS